jgi:hypothetical protein
LDKVAARAHRELSFTVLPAGCFAEIDRREAAYSLAASSNAEIWWRSPFLGIVDFPHWDQYGVSCMDLLRGMHAVRLAQLSDSAAGTFSEADTS